VTIEIDGIGYFGAHLVKGKTIRMNLVKDGDQWKALFEGEDADVNSFVNEFTQRFDQMLYWSPDPSESKSNVEYRQLLAENYEKVKKALNEFKNTDIREHYACMTESMNKWLTIRLIMDSCENDESNYKLNAEYRELVKGIDVNDPINLRTNMAYTALNSLNTVDAADTYASGLRLMQLTDSLVTNPAMRTFMVQMVGQQCFVYSDGNGDSDAFIEKYIAWSAADSSLAKLQVAQFLEKQKSVLATQSGTPAPDVNLSTPDGQTIQLSSLINGKFTYIDVWATWCGPCCKEIPFMEKLVAKYKDHSEVQFLSISIDQNKEAWLNKLEKDNPQWPQFILQGEEESKFSKDWGISGIPRFIMINPDGTIYDADASRPSDAKTTEIIDAQISK
jgi:thiol-disulfide isomerase/thioredoxin